MTTRFKADAVPQWEDIAARGLVDVIGYFVRAFESLGSGADIASLAARYFLGWLADRAERGDPDAGRLLSQLRGDPPPEWTDGDRTKALLDAMNAWRAHIDREGMFSPTTRVAYIRRLSAAFEALGNSVPARFPIFSRKFLTVPNERGDVVPLGALGWIEYATLSGMARERSALELVKADALSAVEEQFSLYQLGQEILAGNEAVGRVHASARNEIRHLLQNERASFKSKGRSSFCPGGDKSWVGDHGAIVRKYSDAELWIDAGFTERQVDCLQWSFSKSGIYRLLLPCLGPTNRLVNPLMLAFACETGWNRAPIATMPRNPFVLELDGGTGVYGSVFAGSFKKRAGHSVWAWIQAGAHRPEGRVEALWQATRREVDPQGEGDGHAILRGDPGAAGHVLLSLRRYQTLADEARRLDRFGVAKQHFLYALTARRGVVVDDPFVVRPSNPDRPLNRPGVGYRSIRISFLQWKYDEEGSVRKLAILGNQKSTSVLQKFYLTSRAIKAAYAENIRFFQNSAQAVLLGDVGDAGVDLVMDPKARRWFGRLATISGVAAAFGPPPEVPGEEEFPTSFRFGPCDENLRGLYLTLLGLVRSRKVVGRARWAVQGIPLVAAFTAIKIRLGEKGLLPAYRKAARQARRDLDAGLVAIPPVLEA